MKKKPRRKRTPPKLKPLTPRQLAERRDEAMNDLDTVTRFWGFPFEQHHDHEDPRYTE